VFDPVHKTFSDINGRVFYSKELKWFNKFATLVIYVELPGGRTIIGLTLQSQPYHGSGCSVIISMVFDQFLKRLRRLSF
jgi:hypothetical protein